MSQDYYDFIRGLNDGLMNISQIELALKALRPQKLGLRHRLQLRLSDFFLSLGFLIRPKIALHYEPDGRLCNEESYVS